MKIVVDANIVISAAFGGVPAQALFIAAHHNICINKEIDREILLTVEKLTERLPAPLLAEIRKQFRTIIHQACHVKTRRAFTASRHAADNAYLAATYAAKARILLSGDVHLLSITPQQLRQCGLQRLRILSPRAFVDEFGPP